MNGMIARATAATALLATLAAAAVAEPKPTRDTEEIFREATKYTVRVRAHVRFAFYGEGSGNTFGAGFLVDRERGWILTNSHVAKKSPARVDVAFVDEDYQPAKRVYIDPHFDMAVIAVPPDRIPKAAQPAALACNDEGSVGKAVAAFGHPYGLRFSGTRGIVSAMRYRLASERLQTDAAINPGNSGGPLIELNDGKIIGINFASIAAPTAQGVHFAVPARHICRILDLMREERDPSPVKIPFQFADIEQREELVVATAGSGPWQALRPGDRIISVDQDKGLRNPSQLTTKLRGRTEPFELVVSRDGAPHSFIITPELTPALIGRVGLNVNGMVLTAPWKDDDFRVNPEGYLVVAHVENPSEAYAARVRPHNVLVSLNGRTFGDPDALYRYLTGPERPKRIRAILRYWAASTAMTHFDYYDASFGLSEVERVEVK
jgi:serine protease Do